MQNELDPEPCEEMGREKKKGEKGTRSSSHVGKGKNGTGNQNGWIKYGRG